MADLLEVSELVVKQRTRIMGTTVDYDLYDGTGTVLGSVAQVGRDDWDRTLHPTADDARPSPSGHSRSHR